MVRVSKEQKQKEKGNKRRRPSEIGNGKIDKWKVRITEVEFMWFKRLNYVSIKLYVL